MKGVPIIMKTKIITYLSRSPFSTLCVMTFCFLAFGYFSLNLFFLFQANIGAIRQFGWLILKEGAALQLLIILLNAFMSVIFYSLWKVCERLVVDWVVGKKKLE